MTEVLQKKSRKAGALCTIEDVARLAGVSTATVSRYLNNPDIVARKSGEKVRAAITELNYVPNALAGSLASSTSQAVAIFVPYLADSLITDTVERLVEHFMAAGTVPLLGITGFDEERSDAAVSAALSRRVSAVVTTGTISESLRSVLRATRTTTIQMWGLAPEPFDVAIGFSHKEVGRALARFAFENGYRRPHLVTALGTRAHLRREGFGERWATYGVGEPTDDTVPIPTHYGHAPAVFAKAMELDPQPDLIITGSDTLAHGVIMQAQGAGLDVPGDLAVVGFGDIKIAAHVSPAITSVQINSGKIAEEILRVIDGRRHGIEPASNRIDCGFQIVRRESA